MESNTERIGKAIFDYFLHRTSSGESFKLCIDSYTYEFCAHQAGISDKELERLLQGEGTDYISNNYSALAIVALETKIAYDVETDSNLVSSYNNRLIDKLDYFDDNNAVQQFYRDWQDVIWEKTKKLFEKENRYLNIPSPRSGPGCYVQYPLSQRIIKGKEIIQYADRFINLHLEPSSGITYQLFEGLVFNRNEYIDDKMKRRMIFSFYCVWDGRSYSDILNRKKTLTREQVEQKAKDECFIQFVPEIKIFVNKKQIDVTKESFADKYLWRLDENKYLTKRGAYFIKDSNYNDWLPYSRAIDSEDDVLIITTQEKYPSYVENLRKTEEIEILSKGIYRFLILRFRNHESFDSFRIPVKTQPYFSLVGGLKLKRNTYYPFALPAVVLTEQKYDKTQYSSVYLDSKEYPIVDGIAQLPEKLAPGKHCIKLLNSWDSSEVYFSVESVSAAPIAETHGWIINESDNVIKPSQDIHETVIDGLTLLGNMEWINRKPNPFSYDQGSDLRPFMQQIDRLENRFVTNKRGRYGN